MENPIKTDDLGGKPTIFGNTHIFTNSSIRTLPWNKINANFRGKSYTAPILQKKESEAPFSTEAKTESPRIQKWIIYWV